jgi:hypothetical protein
VLKKKKVKKCEKTQGHFCSFTVPKMLFHILPGVITVNEPLTEFYPSARFLSNRRSSRSGFGEIHIFLMRGPGLPDGIFSDKKYQFGQILEGLAMEDVGIFYGHLVYFTDI